VGLLLSHKRTRITIYPDMVTFSQPGQQVCEPGKRGAVEVMSKASRMRLLKLMHQITYTSVTMVTLTYPAEYPRDGRKVKAQLKEFRRRFEKKFGKLRALWRLEFQKRGAPHFHILYFDCGFIPVGEISSIWYLIVKSGDPNHLKNGVDLKRVHEGSDRAIIMHYVSKYIAKAQKEVENDEISGIGRWWGYWNVNIETPFTVDVAHGIAGIIASKLISNRRDGVPWEPSNRDCFTLFGSSMGTGEYCEYVFSVIDSLGAKAST